MKILQSPEARKIIMDVLENRNGAPLLSRPELAGDVMLSIAAHLSTHLASCLPYVPAPVTYTVSKFKVDDDWSVEIHADGLRIASGYPSGQPGSSLGKIEELVALANEAIQTRANNDQPQNT